jgi:hypothetical protein
MILLQLRGDPRRPSLAGAQAELAKLKLVRRIGVPADLFNQVLPHELERYRRRVTVEAPYELRRHPEAARLTWLAAFVHLCGRQLTANHRRTPRLGPRPCQYPRGTSHDLHSPRDRTRNRPAAIDHHSPGRGSVNWSRKRFKRT